MREHAGPPPRHQQRRDRRDDRAASAADGVGDRATGRARRSKWNTRRCAASTRCSTPRAKVNAVRFTAEHNYNKDSREAMYAWMARWLQHAPDDVKKPERSFSVDKITDLLVFYDRPLPDGAVTAGAADGPVDRVGEGAGRGVVAAGARDRACVTRSASARSRRRRRCREAGASHGGGRRRHSPTSRRRCARPASTCAP